MDAKILIKLAVAGALVAGSFSAAAYPVTNYWYSGFGGFVENTDSGFPDPVNFSGYQDPREPDPNTWQTMEWGTETDDGQSGASINEMPPGGTPPNFGGPIDGSGLVDGARVDLGYLVHHNEVIGESFAGNVELHYNIWLWESNPADRFDPTSTMAQLHLGFQIDFTETLNEAPCPPPNPEGSECDDFFTYAPLSGPEFTATTFKYMGGTYTANITGFWDAAAPGGQLEGTFYSAEGVGHSVGYVHLDLQQVPAPASLALVSIGLLGLGASRRRRKQFDKS